MEKNHGLEIEEGQLQDMIYLMTMVRAFPLAKIQEFHFLHTYLTSLKLMTSKRLVTVRFATSYGWRESQLLK